MPSAFSSNPTMKVEAKPVKLWFTHNREKIINCKLPLNEYGTYDSCSANFVEIINFLKKGSDSPNLNISEFQQ
jgi:hypothetical protein